jgi:hypothetical protein
MDMNLNATSWFWKVDMRPKIISLLNTTETNEISKLDFCMIFYFVSLFLVLWLEGTGLYLTCHSRISVPFGGSGLQDTLALQECIKGKKEARELILMFFFKSKVSGHSISFPWYVSWCYVSPGPYGIQVFG